MNKKIKSFAENVLKLDALMNPHSPNNGDKVEDVCVGFLLKQNSTWTFNRCNNYHKINCFFYASIVIVLESPHIDEFSNKPYLPLQNSKTKNTFDKRIVNVMKDILDAHFQNKSCVFVYLMNSIQSQCSLATDTSKYRDLIFCYLWNQNGKGDFCTRINNYCSQKLVPLNNIVFVNCCTEGNHSFRQINNINFKNGKCDYNFFAKVYSLRFANTLLKCNKIISLKSLPHLELQRLSQTHGFIVYERKHPVNWFTKQ